MKTLSCKLKKTIKNTILLYAKNKVQFDENDHVVGECEFTVNDQLFFETLLMMIRGETISYASHQKKQKINIEQAIEQKIRDLEGKLISQADKITLSKEIDKVKLELESFRLKQAEENAHRSRIK